MLITTGPSHAAEASVTATIAAIYEAAVVPDGWTAALTRLRGLFGTASTAYVVANAERTRVDRVAAEFDPEGHRANVNSLLRSSIFYTRGKEYSGQIIRGDEIVPKRIAQRSRIFQEVPGRRAACMMDCG